MGDKGLDAQTIKKLPGPPEFTEELRMRQETDGVLLESFLIYEPEHQATWFKDEVPLLGALDFDEKYQPFLERRGDWTYCALAIRHLSNEDAGNYKVVVKNKHGEKANHVRLSMKDENAPILMGLSQPSSENQAADRKARSYTWSVRLKPCPDLIYSGILVTSSWRRETSTHSTEPFSLPIQTFILSG